MELVADILEKSVTKTSKFKSTSVNKLLDVEYDVGALLVVDTNDLDTRLLAQNKNDYLLNLTRDNTQLLLNNVWDLPTERIEEAIVVKLPPQRYVLPRAKPIPKPKTLTKWQQFAKLKGIQKKKKSKLSWDEQLKKWVPLYGYRRAVAQKEKDWVLEVPQNVNPMEDQFAKKAEIKGEKVAKNELQRLRNIARAKKVKIPRVGLTNPDVSSAKELQTAVTVARSSTASLGKFQSKLSHEKEARGVAAITPGATRKRKLPPVSSAEEQKQNLSIVESVLSKKPKIDIEKAVSRQINEEQLQRSREKQDEKPRNSKGRKKGGSGIAKGKGAGKKPKSGKGQRKGVKNVGRKRR